MTLHWQQHNDPVDEGSRPEAAVAVSSLSIDQFCASMSISLVKMLTLRVGDRHLAEEMAQEALAQAVADWNNVSTMANPGGYVYRIALNHCRSSFRRRSAERRALKRLRSGEQRTLVLESRETAEFRTLVGTLTRREQEVLALRYGADLSVQQSASVLGLTEGSVKTLTHRGLAKLRKSKTGAS